MNAETITGVVRHILTFGGGFLVAKGWVDQETLMQGVAALVALFGVGWSIFAKRKTA